MQNRFKFKNLLCRLLIISLMLNGCDNNIGQARKSSSGIVADEDLIFTVVGHAINDKNNSEVNIISYGFNYLLIQLINSSRVYNEDVN